MLSNISAEDPDLYVVFCQIQGVGRECEFTGTDPGAAGQC